MPQTSSHIILYECVCTYRMINMLSEYLGGHTKCILLIKVKVLSLWRYIVSGTE